MLGARRAALIAALAFLAVPLALGAQRVSGVVKLPGGATTAGGILLIAKDSSGTEVARAVTSEQGRVALPLPGAGFYRVELQRVGYAPTVVLERAVSGGETVPLDTIASAKNTVFPPRGSTAPNSCSNSPEERAYVAVLLDEARKALLATQLNASRPGVTARWAVTDHRLAANGNDTTRLLVARKTGSLVTAFGTPVLGELQRGGYVITAGRDRLFRGLDLATLLSPWFQESYCFTAHEGSPSAFLVSFSPKNRPRDRVDIAGEMSFSRATFDLLRIQYLYEGLPQDESQRLAGGHMHFARATGGSWLVSEWMIRFPQIGLLELETFRAQNQARVLQPEVLGHELLTWRTTAMLEGTRRAFVNDALPEDAREGPIRSLCTERVITTRTGAARGRLTLDGRPVSGARIAATWRNQLNVGGEEPLWRDEIREATTTSRGDWVLCDLPANATVELAWDVMGRRTTGSVRVARDEVVEVGSDGKVVR